MNTVVLRGGLGNQLFQYAYGRALEERGRAVRFERDELDRSNRTYLLDAFNTRVCFSTSNGLPTVNEQGLRFNSWWLDEVMPHARLRGYWQCERYFETIADKLRRELTLREPPHHDTHVIAVAIQEAKVSVGLHVRRSDSLHPLSAHHGVLAVESYYRHALEHAQKTLGDFELFIFSDDPAWCREQFRDATIVACNPMSGTCDAEGNVTRGERGREHEDLWLMSLCDAMIIANSTFSWWGAWLRPKKLVIAPERWFLARYDSTDIVPARWLKL